MFTRFNFGRSPVLTLHGFDALTLEFHDGFLRFDVLFLERFLAFAGEMVLFDLLVGCELSNLLDTFCIQNVVGIQQLQSSLFQVVNRTVVQLVSIQVGADDFQNLCFKLLAFVIEFDKVEIAYLRS